MAAFTASPNNLSDGMIWGKTIIFSNLPAYYHLYVEEISDFIRNHKKYKNRGVLNYTQIYDACSSAVKEKFIPPSEVRTGDILQINEGPRGVGAFYAMWLYKDIVKHDLTGVNMQGSEDQGRKKRERDNQHHIDPFSWGLQEAELKNLKRIVANEDYEQMQEDLKAFLLPRQPRLFDIFQTEEGCDYEGAISNLRFPDDHAEPLGDEEGEEDQYEDDENSDYINEYNMTPNASSHFSPPIAPAPYPRMLKRSALSCLCDNPLFQLYLFPHVDEYGYCAPPCMSMAGFNYFPWEYNARHIDLTLLPPPLDVGTVYGRKLNFIVDRINDRAKRCGEGGEQDAAVEVSARAKRTSTHKDEEEREEEDKGEEEGDHQEENEEGADEDDEEEQPMRTVKKSDVLLEIDFEGEDAITYWDINKTFGSREPSVKFTRVVFAAHAEKMREAITGVGGGEDSTEEEVDRLLRHLMGV